MVGDSPIVRGLDRPSDVMIGEGIGPIVVMNGEGIGLLL